MTFARLPFGKLIVAIASKHARQLWVVLAHELDYDARTQYHHSMHRTEATA